MSIIRHKRMFIDHVCKLLEIDYWKGDYHHFGYKNIKKFKSCKTLHDAFVYAEGLYDGYHAIEK